MFQIHVFLVLVHYAAEYKITEKLMRVVGRAPFIVRNMCTSIATCRGT